MLARIDRIPGVSRSRAECSGHYFILELSGGADASVAARAVETLGRGARVLEGEEAGAQLAARRRGEPWVGAEEARGLAYVEGRIVGVRVAAAVAREGALGDEERTRLAETVREEMFAHVEKILAGAASAGRFFEDWPEIAARVAARCAPWLEGARAARIAALLAGHFGGTRRA